MPMRCGQVYDNLRGRFLGGGNSRGKHHEVEVVIESSDQGPACVSILNHFPEEAVPAILLPRSGLCWKLKCQIMSLKTPPEPKTSSQSIAKSNARSGMANGGYLHVPWY